MTDESIERGFITLSTKDDGSMLSSYMFAMSVKLSNDEYPVCLVVDKFKSVPTKYEHAFDYIVELPFSSSGIVGGDLWQIYYCTPFEESIYVNPHSLILNDVSYIWDRAISYDVLFSEKTSNFRYGINNKEVPFLFNDQNKIPTLYTDVFYFNKSDESSRFFKMLDVCSQNWREVYGSQLPMKRKDYFDIGVILNITIKMMAYRNYEVSSASPLYTTVNLDSITSIGNRSEYPDLWVDAIPYWVTPKMSLRVGNVIQTGIFVYEHEKFLTDEIIDVYRENFKNYQTAKEL